MIKLLFNSDAKSSPSRASPPLNEPSPIIAMIFSLAPLKSLPLARPQARLTDVDVCPILKKS